LFLAGSLLNLAKHPASTVQILGAEKALFRALKTRHDTPKYGLIYHAQLVGSSSIKLRGKISRMLAAKTALAVRVDALGEDATGSAALGIEHRATLERRVLALEQGVSGHRISGTKKFEKYTPKQYVCPKLSTDYRYQI
jgi:nucleolar protein 58